jgi:filamentous hemagglutinin family protein
MVINQSTARAAIDWRSFNIERGQSVTFAQPDAKSITLNKVLGNDASAILGSLRANGQVFLVNPNGVYFSPTATVDTAALLVSSLGMSTQDFMSGSNAFALTASSASSGVVRNEGVLTSAPGGFVVLAGGQVLNLGEINTPQGTAALLAGKSVTIDRQGDGLVRFTLDAGVVRALVENSGTIAANGGSVALMAAAIDGAMGTVVNQTGVIRANGMDEKGGMVTLRAIGGDTVVRGRIEANGSGPGAAGGVIQVLGDRVGLFDQAAITATGDGAGGIVHVGGGYQGIGDTPTSTRTIVGPGVTINASSLVSGHGGEVVVWSDGRTDFLGSIMAVGGAAGGDGGLAETSGKQALSMHGVVNVTAANGNGGTWLLDPNNITIAAANANLDATGLPANGGATFFQDDATGTNATVSAASLGAQLTGGATIIVRTSNNGTAGGSGSITVNSAVTAAGSGTLNLIANGDITINQAIASAGGANTLNVGLFAGSDGAPATVAGAGNQAGVISSAAAGSITTNGGDITLVGSAISLGGAMNTSGVSGTGNVSMTSTLGGISQSGVGTITAKGIATLDSGASNTVLNLVGNDFQGTVNATGGVVSLSDTNALTAVLTASGAGTLQSGGALVASGSAAGLTTTSGGTTAFGVTTVNGALGVTSTGAVTQTGALVVSGVTTLNSGATAITLDRTDNDFQATVNATGGVVSLRDTNALTAALTASGAGTLQSGGALVASGSAAGLTTTSGGTTAFGVTTVNGALGVTSTGAVTQTGALVVSGVTTLNSGGDSDHAGPYG